MATFDLFRDKSLSRNKLHRNNSGETIHKICLKNGILTSILLIMSFFALCGLTNHLEIHELSVINMFLLAFGSFFALQNISPNGKGGSVDYFEGLKVGMYTSLVSIGLHSLFLLIYTYFYPSVLTGNSHFFGIGSNPIAVAGATVFEGLAGAFIITFCLMQYFKKNEH